jgi:4-amino-4-deoxy-L-arabinose transferase-like glycosyltransferase
MLLLDRGTTAVRPASAVTADGERRRTRLVLAAALLLCLGLRLPYMNFPLGTDEGGVAFIAKAWGTGGHGSLYGAYWLDRPPLLVALYKLAVPGGAVGIRVLGALAALALVVGTTVLARAVAGDHAARVAALLSAGLASSIALTAVFAPAELLAAAPACASVVCLVTAHRRGQARWLVGAGVLAVTAALIKQSFLDAGFAGAVFLIARSLRDRRPRLRWAVAYAAGALIGLAGVAAWLLVAHESAASLAYAVFGFRIDALHALSASSSPLHVRVHSLLGPGALSGMFVVLIIALRGLWTLRGDRVLAVTLAAWLAAGAVGVLGGGSYWPHYLIQLVAPACLLAGAALSAVRISVRAAAVTALAAVAIIGTVGARSPMQASRGRSPVISVAHYVRAHARPGDTQYVMYAHANVGYYTGLQSPYPYAWSLLVRAIPGAPARLLQLLRSPQRPTWIVGWERPDRWQLDPHRAIAGALQTHYRVVARVDGHPIYHRTSAPALRRHAAELARAI